MRFYDKDCNPEQLSPLTLAFIGDSVFDLFVRERLICLANRPVNVLHSMAVTSVKASAQAEAAKKIAAENTETDEELMKELLARAEADSDEE